MFDPVTTYILWDVLSGDGGHPGHEVVRLEGPDHYGTLEGCCALNHIAVKVDRNQNLKIQQKTKIDA